MWQLIMFIVIVGLIAAGGLVIFFKVPGINAFFKDRESLFLPALQAGVSGIVGIGAYFDWNQFATTVQAGNLSQQAVIGGAIVGLLHAIGMFIAAKART